MFKVETREQAEEVMKQYEYTWEWIQIEDGSYDCILTTKLMTAYRVASTGRKVFFNQIVAAFTGWTGKRN